MVPEDALALGPEVRTLLGTLYPVTELEFWLCSNCQLLGNGHLGRYGVMTAVLGPLLCMWETLIEFTAPSFSLAWLRFLCASGE